MELSRHAPHLRFIIGAQWGFLAEDLEADGELAGDCSAALHQPSAGGTECGCRVLSLHLFLQSGASRMAWQPSVCVFPGEFSNSIMCRIKHAVSMVILVVANTVILGCSSSGPTTSGGSVGGRFAQNYLDAFQRDELALMGGGEDWRQLWWSESTSEKTGFRRRIEARILESYSWPRRRIRAFRASIKTRGNDLGLCLAASLLVGDRCSETFLCLWDEGMNCDRSSFCREWLLNAAQACQLSPRRWRIAQDGTLTRFDNVALREPSIDDVRDVGLIRAHIRSYKRFQVEYQKLRGNGASIATLSGLGWQGVQTFQFLLHHLPVDESEVIRELVDNDLDETIGLLELALGNAFGRDFESDGKAAVRRIRPSWSAEQRYAFLTQPLRDLGIDPLRPFSDLSQRAFIQALKESDRANSGHKAVYYAARWFNEIYDVSFDVDIIAVDWRFHITVPMHVSRRNPSRALIEFWEKRFAERCN